MQAAMAAAEQTPASAVSFRPDAALRVSREHCAILGCPHQARIRVNGKGACGHHHLEHLLRGSMALEQARRAKTRSRTSAVPPVGQVLLRAGTVTEAALADALRAQERAGTGRIGAWLRQQSGLCERALAAALAVQQGCPVLSLEDWSPEPGLAPQVFFEHCSGIPLRGRAAPGLLAVAFEDKSSPELVRALELMHACRVVQGVLPATAFWEAAREWLALRQMPKLELAGAPETFCPATLGRLLLDAGAHSASVAVLHDRIWLRYAVEERREHDLVCMRPPEAAGAADSFSEPAENAAMCLAQIA